MIHAESRGLELAVGLALPATLGLIALSAPVVRMLFEHGAFTATDAAATAQALIWLALGLPAHVLVKALSPAFFARDDTTTPLLATLTGVAVAVVLALVLGRWFGAGGIAAGIAMGAWSSALALIRRGAATFGFSIDAAARRRLPRIVAAALAMGGRLWLTAPFVLGLDLGLGLGLGLGVSGHGLAQAVAVALLISGGAAIYALLLGLLGVIRWDEAVKAIRLPADPGLRD
jgi:putative peptidoglycan lipid II flippase